MIIPFFLASRGCPHRCSFCNQELSGGDDPRELTPVYFHRKVQSYLAGKATGRKSRREAQIAFYGGNFTGLDPAEQERLLGMARRYLETGAVSQVRLSTRPDALDRQTAKRLAAAGVRTVEIGAQSLVDEVLTASRRGHDAAAVTAAVAAAKEENMEVFLHLMAGLPGDNEERFAITLSRTIALLPRGVRLHPTLVLAGTPLAEAYRQGRYVPLTIPEAVDICRRACVRLEEAGIVVIRLGLQDTEALRKPGSVLGGPYHPAFGALVAAAGWRERAFALLAGTDLRNREVVFHIPDGAESAFRGNRNGNLKALQDYFGLASLRIIAQGNTFGYRIGGPERGSRGRNCFPGGKE